MPEPKLYQFSNHIGAVCTSQFRTFQDLARELHIYESFLQRLADEVRKDLRAR
jgi:hypothetical protein